MALVEAARFAVRATPAERFALRAAAHIAELVAWRIERRSASLTASVTQRQAREQAAAAREDAITRAHSLGLLR